MFKGRLSNQGKCYFDINKIMFLLYIGTNWSHEVLSMIITQSTSYNKINPGDGFLEIVANKDHFKTIKSPRLFLSHLPYRYLPRQLRNGTGRIVYVQRNPKDLHVSFFNFMKGKEAAMGKETSWEEFFERSVLGEGWYTTYSME